MKTVCLIGIILSLGLHAAEDSLKSSALPFFLTPPTRWECIVDAQQLPKKVKLVYVGNGQKQFTPSLNVACEETTMTIKEYVTLAKAYHESQGDTRCSLMGTLETKGGTAHLLQIDRPTQWGEVRFIQAVLIKQGIAYLMTATCLQEEFGSLSSQFFKSIQSFNFLQH